MIIKIKKIMFNDLKEVLFVWVIIFFAILIRVWKADYYPIHNNDDSLFHVWAGTSSFKNLLKPASLTIFIQNNPALFWYSQYNNTDVIRRFSFRLEQPYFDQPPLMMFFIALPAKIFGFTDFVQVPQILVRLPALLVSIISLYFTYILAKIIYNKKIALLALIVYGFTPFYVFSHRQSYLENFLTPVILLGLIALKKYLLKPDKLWIFLLLLTSLIAGWIKIVGFGLFLITGFWLLKNKKNKLFILNTFIGILSIISYLIYGASIDWTQFILIVFTQAARGVYLNSFVHIFTQPEFYELFLDGWYYLNFICMFVLIIKKRHNKDTNFLCLNFIFWLFFILMTSGMNNNSPWYRYPLFPFLSIATGYYLNLLLTNNSLLLMLPILLFGLTNLELLQISITSPILRIFYLIITLPYFLKLLWPKIKFINFSSKISSIILLVLALSINILIPLKYLSSRCKKNDCLLPEKIKVDLSSVKN